MSDLPGEGDEVCTGGPTKGAGGEGAGQQVEGIQGAGGARQGLVPMQCVQGGGSEGPGQAGGGGPGEEISRSSSTRRSSNCCSGVGRECHLWFVFSAAMVMCEGWWPGGR